MPALLELDEARALIETDRTDAELTLIIAREEAAMVRKLGAHGDGVTSETVVLDGTGGDLYLPRPAASVTSIGGTAWASLGSGVALLGRQGRVTGGSWSGATTVIYVPADDRDERRAALVDLVRLTLERRTMKAESVAGEYSYTAPESWEAERAAIYRRLRYASI